MRYVKWGFIGSLLLLVFSFFHYTLPQVDIVRIVSTETQRIDLSEGTFFWSAPETGLGSDTKSVDTFFIHTFSPSQKPMVYRNQNTGWGWPPYFKFNSFNLQAQASNLISTEAAPKWVAVRHYGWRNEFFSIFPNAVSIWAVEGPEVTIIPWINLLILGSLAALLVLFWRMWAQFRERTLDPAMDRIGDHFDAADERATKARGRIRNWFSRK